MSVIHNNLTKEKAILTNRQQFLIGSFFYYKNFQEVGWGTTIINKGQLSFLLVKRLEVSG